MKALSPRQKHILEFIRRFLADKGYPPTVRDIVNGCSISSTSVAAYNLEILGREGYIRRHPEVSRGIELLDGSSALRSHVQVPIIGPIAAGEPIPVPSPETWDVTASSETMEVTRDLTRGREGIYALRVKGSSMVDALINDGDIVILSPSVPAAQGHIAIIRIANQIGVTCKLIRTTQTDVHLIPINERFETKVVAKKDLLWALAVLCHVSV